MTTNVDAVYAPDLSTRYALPVFLGRLAAGFPSPADDYIEGRLDLNRHLITHPAATFFVRASSNGVRSCNQTLSGKEIWRESFPGKV